MTRARDLAKGTFSGDLTVDTNTLVVDSANNRVGVGTVSPAAQLSILGNVNIGNNDSSNPSSYLRFGASQHGAADIRPSDEGGHKIGLDFYTDGTGDVTINPTFAMRINSSGNVGIGTSSPSGELHVKASSGFAEAYVQGSNSSSGMYLFDQGTEAGLWKVDSGYLAFGTANTERMRINSSGDLLVGTTVVGQPNANAMAYDRGGMMRLSRVDGNTGNYIYFIYNGLGIGSIANNGGSAVSFNTSSDYRLKTDAQPMVGASDRVLALKPINFAWKVDGTRVDGFLAHEAQEIVPEAVTGTKDAMRDEEYEVTAAIEATYDEDGNELTAAVEAVMGTRSVPDYQGIDQSKLVPLLTAALQEALTKIASMETRLAALEAN